MTDTPWIDVLDVSAAQGHIDFERVAAAPVAPGVQSRWRGVICKVSEGGTYKDPTFLENVAGARAVGMPFGAYAYWHPMIDAELQAENAYNAIGDTMPSFAFTIDLEAADRSLTSQQLIDRLRRARDAVLRRFVRLPRVYSYPDFWATRMLPAAAQALDVAELPLHWASYGTGRPWYPKRSQLPKAPDPWRSAGKRIEMWQYSGNTTKVPGAWNGRVDGITGDVDRNVYTGTEDEFRYDFCGQPRPEQLEDEPPIVHPPLPEIPRALAYTLVR